MLTAKMYYRVFLSVFVTCYFIFTWLPQYSKDIFVPANFSMPLSGLGMDFYAGVVGARMASIGKSAHLVDDSPSLKIYPYPIGKTYQSYGSLAIAALFPFIHFPFHYLRMAWLLFTLLAVFFLTDRGLRHLKVNTENILAYGSLLMIVGSLYFILSGPLNLLVERGQLEIIIPLLLFFVWKNYRNDKNDWVTGILLGTSIHIKLWPCVLLLLFMERKNRKVLITALAAWVIPYFLLNSWLPLRDLIQSTSQYSNAASQMVGWANISLHSLMSIFPRWVIPWKLSTAVWLALFSMMMLYIHAIKIVDIPEKRDLLFCTCVFGAFLAPGFMCDYVLASILLLVPALGSNRLNYGYAILLGILFSNLLFFGVYAGVVKAALLLMAVLMGIAAIFNLDLIFKGYFGNTIDPKMTE